MKFDKEKIRKMVIAFVGFAVMITGIDFLSAVMKHQHFSPNPGRIIIAAILCALVITFVPKLEKR